MYLPQTYIKKLNALIIKKNLEYKELKQAQYEYAFLSYPFRKEVDYLIFPHLFNDKKGIYVKFSSINNEVLDYLEHRINKTSNIFLKAKYTYIYWKSTEKSNSNQKIKYANLSVCYFLKIADYCLQKFENNDYENLPYTLKLSLKIAYTLGTSIKYRKDEVKFQLLNIIFNEHINFSIKYELIEFILKEKNFNQEDFIGIDELCWNSAKNEKEDYSAIQDLKLGLKVCKKLKNNTNKWNEAIGKRYEYQMISREEFLIKHTSCNKAISYYKKCHNEEKVDELLLNFEKICINYNLPEIKVPLNLSGFKIVVDQDVISKINFNSYEMINYLMYYDSLPLIVDDNLLDSKFENNFSILKEATTIILDYNKNIRKQGEYDNLQFNKSNLIILTIEITSELYLKELFILSIENRIFTYEDIINFFENYTWYNQKINNERENLLYLLEPPIKMYFEEMDNYIKNKDYNFLLPVQSLTLTLEKIIRQLLKKNGKITTYQKQKGVTGIFLLNKLFNEDLKEILTKNDYLFLEHILLEEKGFNLRNRVAHLIDNEIYNVSTLHMLLLGIFRLAKY